MDKVQCSNCESLILPSTAERNSGQCAPCYKASHVEPKIPPNNSAYYPAGLLFLGSALATGILLILLGFGSASIVSIVVDGAIGFHLLSRREGARYYAIAKATLSVFGAVFIHSLSNPEITELVYVGLIQSFMAISVLCFLAGRTTVFRMISGYIFGSSYLLIVGGAVWITLNA
ncbi:hypothetical protein ACMXYV_07595 [Neptuniibacter sp. SY11_33]|uniref:hypothetical protein n=1 Tax=Neptuniibacter sp. SY11_33 TaxID=3398215 RepID=UPI0039F53504